MGASAASGSTNQHLTPLPPSAPLVGLQALDAAKGMHYLHEHVPPILHRGALPGAAGAEAEATAPRGALHVLPLAASGSGGGGSGGGSGGGAHGRLVCLTVVQDAAAR